MHKSIYGMRKTSRMWLDTKWLLLLLTAWEWDSNLWCQEYCDHWHHETGHPLPAALPGAGGRIQGVQEKEEGAGSLSCVSCPGRPWLSVSGWHEGLLVPRRIKKGLCHQEEAVWTRGLVLQTSGRAEVRRNVQSSNHMSLDVLITVIINVINNNECLSGYLIRHVYRF